MFGRGRKAGKATVVARQMDQDSGFLVGSKSYHKFAYVLDIAPEDGSAPFRTQAVISVLQTTEFEEPAEGDLVRVTYRGAGEDVKFDNHSLRMDAKLAKQTRAAELDALAAQPPGTGVPPSTSQVAPLDPELQAFMDAEESGRGAS